ncbi:zinc ribbon domain-containing protein [Streptomyces sp. NPDC048361]|uniref:zinc ribbon domain-containing protein n=1 Tax=Streptomyces sp. NPDC048361 TaxID=3154720 RepID=UPI003423D736
MEQRSARMVADLGRILATASPDAGGALWRLGESGRGLDANLLRLPPGRAIDEHTDLALDVLLVVLEGGGHLRTEEGTQELRPVTALWLPKGSRRALVAGTEGMGYLSVHRRRPGLTIGGPPSDEGGEAACLLAQVCPECGRLATERGARFCWSCGTALQG